MKKCSDTKWQRQNKQKGINTVSQRGNNTTGIYSESDVLHKHTNTVAVGQKVGASHAVVSVRDREPSSLRAGPVERGPDAEGLTHSFGREGVLSAAETHRD